MISPELAAMAVKKSRLEEDLQDGDDDLSVEYWGMLSTSQHTDITIKTENDSTSAHRCVLATMSPVFRAMFNNDMLEQNTAVINLPDMSTQALRVFLLLLYCGHTGVDLASLQNQCLLEVFAACHKYDISYGRKQACVSVLLDSITLENCWETMESAYTYNSVELSEACKAFIVNNVQDIPNMVPIICTLELVTLNSSMHSRTAQVYPMKVWSAGTVDNIKADIRNVLHCCTKSRLHLRAYLKAGSWIDFEDDAKISDILESLSDGDTRITLEVFHRQCREYYGLLKLGSQLIQECK
jgi:speckle-type POZ protein